MNRPFFSTNTNLLDESRIISTPTTLNGQNVIVSQGQQRRLFDVLNTSISGLPYTSPQAQGGFYPGNYIQAQSMPQPDGVLFQFNSNQQPNIQTGSATVHSGESPMFTSTPNGCFCGMALNPNQQAPYPPQNIQQQIGLNGIMKQMELAQYQQQQEAALQNAKNYGLQIMDYQQLLSRNPFQLNFHRNVGTSSSDIQLCPRSPELFPNFNDCCCALGFGQLHIPVDLSDKKKLILSQPPAPATGHVSDVLDKEKSGKKNVLFQDNCCGCSYDKSESNTGQSTVPVNNQCETKRSLVIAQQTEPVMRIDQAEQTSLDYCKCSVTSNSRKVRNRRKKSKSKSIEYETVSESSSSSEEIYEE